MVEGAEDDKVKVNWDLASGLRRGHGVALPDGRARDVRQADDRGRGAGRGGEGRVHLPLHRRRHDPERRRVPAAAGLQRRPAEGRPRARHQHGDRNGVQRALGLRGEGAAPRRHDAARPQADDPGAAQEVDRRGQRADPGELQEGLRDVSRHRLHRPHAADSRHQCRRGAHPGGPGVHPPAQERDRLRAAAVSPLRPGQVLSTWAWCTSWTTTRRRPTIWSAHLQAIIDEAFGRTGQKAWE
ncbi:MAG: hypothetical protein MZV64_04880 [Ignavibacteriales bacterium]|nr:hypothetical protein [Ignavibacteriales bacterium]